MNKKLIKILFCILGAAGIIACGPKGEEPTPDPGQKDTMVVNVQPGNDYVVYQANEKIFAKNESFKAIDARLDEIKALGTNVLWLMPIHPIGQEKTANSPYCVRDFKGVNPRFGTLADLKSLVNHAHSKGMIVILDWIANHAAWDNQWVKDHPDWFTTAQTADERNWNDVTFFDFSKREVREAMIDAMTYWVSEADIDGFRCDYAQGCPDDFWKEAIDAIRAIKPEALMLAETSRQELFNVGFDWMYSWSYLSQIQKLLTTGSLASLYSTSESEVESTPAGKLRLRYVTNHDACSEHSNQECYKTQEGLLAASCLTYYLGGVPLIYSSQEIGYMRSINFCCTSDASVLMNWSDNPSTLEAYKKMMHIYHATDTLRGGELRHIDTNPKVAQLTYTSEAGTLYVMVNVSADAETVAVPQTLINATMHNYLTDQDERLPRNVQLEGYGYRIFSK